MRFQIDYSLKGESRVWYCEAPRNELSLDDALKALIQLHTPLMTQLLHPDSMRSTDDERKQVVQDLGISDVRVQALHL